MYQIVKNINTKNQTFMPITDSLEASKTEVSKHRKRKYRVSCICGSWLLNSDTLPESDAIFNCRNCKKAHSLSDLNVKKA